MKKRKLNYRFHNPNTTATTANHLLEILIDANQEKVQLAIQAAADVENRSIYKNNEGRSA